MKNIGSLRHNLVLIVWTVLTAYTLSVVSSSSYALLRSHYVNFGLLAIALVALFFEPVVRYSAIMLLLLIGFFTDGAFTPHHYFLRCGHSFIVSPTFLLLLLSFVLLNRRNIPEWYREIFNEK